MFKLKVTKPVPKDAHRKTQDGEDLARIKVGGRWLWLPVNDSGRVRIPTKTWYARIGGKLEKLSEDRSISETLLREKKNKLERIQRGIELPEPEGGNTVAELIGRYKADRDRRGLTPNSTKNVIVRLHQTARQLELAEIADLRKVTGDRLDKWISEKATATGTIMQDLGTLRTFMKWVKRLGLLHVVPEFPRLKIVAATPRAAFQADLVTKLAEAAPFERALLWRLMFVTGARISAMLATRTDDYHLDDPKGPWLRLRAENAKTKREQDIPLPTKVAGDLKKYIAMRKPGDKVFAHGFTNPVRLLEKDLKAAGISQNQPGGKLVVHSFRHGAVSAILKVLPPAVAAAVTGHTSLEMLQAYSHVSGLDGAQPIRALFRDI